MQKKNQQLVSLSETQKQFGRTESLIREWIFRFGIEHKEDVAAKLPLWLEAFRGMYPDVLNRLFAHALRTLKWFPKVSEILSPVRTAENHGEEEKAERAWQWALDYRRLFWNPDMPGGFSRSAPKLSERMTQATRAAGIFRDFDSMDDLHTWAKKRFIESYLRYAEMEQEKFLLPNGELKSAIAEMAKAKELPSA